MVAASYKHLLDFIDDHTPVVLKSVCEALRLCLPMLLLSTQPTRGEYVYVIDHNNTCLNFD